MLQRATSRLSDAPPFFVYIDEFQNFVTDTVAYMLAEARKFGLALTLGEQSMLDAALGNCGSAAGICVYALRLS